MEFKGTLAHLDLNRQPDHLLQRVANGEHIMSVLASVVPQREDGRVGVKGLLAGPEPRQIEGDEGYSTPCFWARSAAGIRSHLS